MTNATIKRGTIIYRAEDGKQAKVKQDIRVKAFIIPEDISVSRFVYKGVEYTIDTDQVVWD